MKTQYITSYLQYALLIAVDEVDNFVLVKISKLQAYIIPKTSITQEQIGFLKSKITPAVTK